MEGIVRSVVKLRLVDSNQKEDDVRRRTFFYEVVVAVVSIGVIGPTSIGLLFKRVLR